MLKLIAPFRAYFNLDSSQVATDPDGFMDYLAHLRTELSAPASSISKKLSPALEMDVNVPPRLEKDEVEARYVDANKNGSLFLFQRIFTLRFKSAAFPELQNILRDACTAADDKVIRYSDSFLPDAQSLRIDFYDNTVAILTLDLHLDKAHIGQSDSAWDKLDKWTTAFTYNLLERLYQKHIFPLLLGLSKMPDRHGQYWVEDIEAYNIFRDLASHRRNPYYNLDLCFRLMWVNRTLFYSNDYPMNAWIRPLLHPHNNESIRIDGAEIHLNSGNNVIMISKDLEDKQLENLWDVMLSAQYYYAAMDIVNVNLIKYLGTVFNRQSDASLHMLSEDMENIINLVTILQVHYNDMMVDLQGVSQKLFHAIQKEWKFENLVRNVDRKLGLCKANITMLSQQTNERNQWRTEIVLKALAGTNLIYLFLAVSGYASQWPRDHMDMVGKFPGFLDLGFIFSGNALTWAGIIITGLLILYTTNWRNMRRTRQRRQQRWN
ncbi:MAG TPA: hypothetical protein VFT64_08425 [Rickettsiales bacterium]|nr:hypothetical protein [Rickettsiales bacterium]